VGNVYGAHIHIYISTFSFLPIKVFSIPFRIVNGMSPSCNPDPEDREVRGEDTGSIRDNLKKKSVIVFLLLCKWISFTVMKNRLRRR
jgi:hypothetical protein